MKPLHIGLTGGIGSGKSTVARFLVDLGAWLVDTDAISRELTAPGGAALPAVRQVFGDDYIDAAGALDRARMRALVFGNPEAKQRLEQLLHPLIGQETRRRAAQAAPGQWVVYDVPLLVESGRWRTLVDQVLVVDCQPATQVARVMARSGLTAEQVQAIIAAQAPRLDRLASADAVVCNEDRPLDELRAEVAQLWTHWHNMR